MLDDALARRTHPPGEALLPQSLERVFAVFSS